MLKFIRFLTGMAFFLTISCTSSNIETKNIDNSYLKEFNETPYAFTIPPRRSFFSSGKKLFNEMENLSGDEREQWILKESLKGNFPRFLTKFKKITNTKRFKGKKFTISLWVMPDYFALGSDSDFFRVPMTPLTAQRIAYYLNCSLPNQFIVDLIFSQAEVKLKPILFKSSTKIVEPEYFYHHNLLIQKQLSPKKISISKLVAGHKKDIVLSNRLIDRPNRVALYGMHQNLKNPLQPLSLSHNDGYVDYSHGTRFISNTIKINGIFYSLQESMSHPVISKLLTYNGPLQYTHVPIKATSRN